MRSMIVVCMILAALLAMRLGDLAGRTDASFVELRRGPDSFGGLLAERGFAVIAHLEAHAAIDLAPVPAQ